MESESLPPGGYQLFLNILNVLQLFDFNIIASIVSVLILLILSGLISGSEVAFFSISPKDIEILKLGNNVNDFAVLKLLQKPRFLLATILIANNFVNVSIIIISNYFLSLLISSPNEIIQVLINVVLVTTILVFFGEVAPKVSATQNNLGLARLTSRMLLALRWLFYFPSWLLVKSGLFIEKRFQSKNREIDLGEIEKAIELSSSNGSTKEDVAMLKGIVNFGNTAVKQIMTPRIDIVALDIEANFDAVMAAVREHGYSRMPVYKESLDKIEGVLYIKDILEHTNQKASFEWQNLIREPMFVPETKKIDDLLREIQENRKHLGIVVDEYGGTSGIVTLEDILEEVVGDINDEFDETIDTDYRKINESTYLFEGKVFLNDLVKILNIDNDSFDEVRGESDSLGGLILELTGEIPKKGTKLNFNNFLFTVLEVEKYRIQKVKVQILDHA